MKRNEKKIWRVFMGFTLIFCAWELPSHGSDSSRPESVPSLPVRSVSFKQANQQILELSRQIVAETSLTFEKLTGKKTGNQPIQIFLTQQLEKGIKSRIGKGDVQGLTFLGKDGYIIQISSRHTSSLGRILAHEVAHIYLREAFGEVKNDLLNEGFAEYLADQTFPTEVRREMRARFGQALHPTMKPYVEGYRFIYDHVEHPQFMNFLAAEISIPCESGRALDRSWKAFLETPQPKFQPKITVNPLPIVEILDDPMDEERMTKTEDEDS